MSYISSRALGALLLIAAMHPAGAQRVSEYDDARWLESCREGGNGWSGDTDRRACEVRNVTVRLSGRAIEVDGRDNGSVRAVGWDGDSVRVTARIQAHSSSESRSNDMLKAIRVETDGKRVHAKGPGSGSRGRDSWSVSYIVYVPRRFDLTFEAHNGSVGVTGVSGKFDLRTVNGSVQLAEVNGDVRARTQNGSLNVQLAGDRWVGSGLDAETQNGSVRIYIPARYAANVETGTVNGRINTEFPVTVQGRIDKRLRLPLNGGGQPVRAITTNGSVTLSQR